MEKDLFNAIIGKLSEENLKNICKNMNLEIYGFRSIEKVPKYLIINKLMQNKNDLKKYLKKMSNESKERDEFKNKNILQIKELIDFNDKEKTLRQIIYLATRNSLECINLAGEIMNHINSNNDNDLLKGNSYLVNRDKFIVTVEEKGDFYNIYPLYKILNGNFIKVDEREFPDYGNINVNPREKFSNQTYEKCSLWICKFNYDDLEETKNKTKFKIDGDKLIKDNNIYDINIEGIYEIAELVEDDIKLDKLIYSDKIEIKNRPIKEKIYIKDNMYIYGPFGFEENKSGGGYFLNKEDNDYIVTKYSIEDNKEFLSIAEIDNPYTYNNSYTNVVYFYKKDSLKYENIDTISESKLLNKFKQVINIENKYYSRDEIDNIIKGIDNILDSVMPKERKIRIKSLIESSKDTKEFVENDLTDIISLLLDNDNIKGIIANKILDKNEILRKLQKVDLVQSEIDSKHQELKSLEKELENIRIQMQDSKEKNLQLLKKDSELEIKNMNSQKENLITEINKLKQECDLRCDVKELTSKKKVIEEEVKSERSKYDMFLLENQKIKEKSKRAEKELKNKLDNIINEYINVPFDGMIANNILESAANWNKKRNKENIENNIASKENIENILKLKTISFDGNNLLEKKGKIIDYIYNNIKQVRDYSRNDVINIMLCITQGFLTVFAGQPGVGKTSICNIIANALGLYRENSVYNRFVEVSVEKGWTSKRDLIGYYNPLTKSFDKNDRALFKTFSILNEEYDKGIFDFPYYILLDEANLSSMEYYWADFMNVCDLSKESRKINLGEDYIYNIPKTLRFLATINYDHTTETLSPRLIDRAWIILLEKHNHGLLLDNNQKQNINNNIIMFDDLEKCFSYFPMESQGTNDQLSSKVYSELEKIYEIFEENNICISPRVNNMIIEYLKVGCTLYEQTKDTAQEFVTLDYAVSQKLLPKINGYGEKYKKNFLEVIENKFDQNNMMKCKYIVDDIIRNGDNNMQYYQFFS
jgi:MoxR-like ATPase